MFKRIILFLSSFFKPKPKPTQWMDEVFSELSEPLMSEEKKNFSPKTIYIEQTLDWSEARQAKLLAKGDIQSASSLSSEFYEWMKAPEGFDHDVLIPEDPK